VSPAWGCLCLGVTFWFFERIEFQFANNATMASIIAESNQKTKAQIPEIATSRPLQRRRSRTISASIARLHSTKPFQRSKPGAWSSASNGTTLQNTAADSIWLNPNSGPNVPVPRSLLRLLITHETPFVV
jgi:hypothetical protein